MINNNLSEVQKNDLPLAEFVGSLDINGYTLPCAVLYADTENPVRVFWQREVVGLLTGNKKGGLERYLKSKNLQPYIPEKYKHGDLSTSIKLFKTVNGAVAHGFFGADLIDLCKMYMQARSAGVLHQSQEHLAIQSEIIVFAFAKTGVDAIIDEVTGFDKVRTDLSLIRNLKRYVSDELQSYYSQFPIEFYKGIYRLNNWAYDDESIKKKPGIVGKWTNEIVYSRFPKGVLARIHQKNPLIKSPVTDKTYRKHKNYNLLTEEVGLIDLQQFISNAIFLMNASSNWSKFKSLLARALGKPYQGDIWDN